MIATAPQVKSLFGQALEIEAPADRSAFLDRACGSDAELRSGVEMLLAAHAEAGRFLDPTGALPAAAVDPPSFLEGPGTLVGPYKLLEQIGEGGMGLVFMAEQTAPVRRKVALKILKPGMDTYQVVARFEAERQALALMDHPNIARVLDAGATAAGRPYFVMELVRGVPITEFCDRHRFDPRRRLQLFVTVCRAVQHAHQKGIIHRDIKPSNVLVTLHDTVPVPKVIDFGIAKATGRQLTERTLFTRFAQMVGTPLYMSPEQAEMNGLDVDTRSDVYSLGVLLYELLTGTTPFEGETLRQAGLDELRRIIREEEPPAPSRRLSTLDARACSTVSARRGVDGRRLGQLLRGELDWVVMRALEKDRDRRYESSAALAADVERYLADEPVAAGPPTAGYRLRKLAHKHRKLLGVAASAALLASAGLATGTVLVWCEKERTRLALEETRREQAAADAQRQRAEANFAKALAGATQILMELDPKPGIPPTEGPALHRALEQQGLRFFRQFIDEHDPDPAVRFESARAYRMMATVYAARRDLAPMRAMMDRALALLDGLAADHPDEALYRRERISTRYLLGLYLTSLGRPREARDEYVRTAELHRQAVALDPSPEAQNACAWFLVDCPDAALHDPPRAATLAAAAVARSPSEGRYWNTLGVARYRAGDWPAASTALQRSAELRGGGDPADWFFLAMTAWRLGDRSAARAWYDRSVAWMRQHLPPGEDLLRYLAEAEALLEVSQPVAPAFLTPP